MKLKGPFCSYVDDACVYCGIKTQRSELSRNCPVKKRFVAMGDKVSGALSLIGINEKSVSRLVGGDCKCAARREKLNRLGYWVQEKALDALVASRRGLLGD